MGMNFRLEPMGAAAAPCAASLSIWIATVAILLSLPNSLPAADKEKDPLVARVNGREIHLSHVYDSIETLSLGDQIDARSDLEVYIEAMINEEVLFQWVLANEFANEPELRKEVKDLVVRHLIEKHVRSKIHLKEKQIRDYYDANPSQVRGEHVRVRQILLKERARCERMMARIDSEEEFAELAKAHSLDPATSAKGGDIGLMMRAEGAVRGHELEFFEMKVGEMRIFDVPEGCLLVRSTFYTNPPLPPFENVKENLRQFLENRQEVMLVENLIKTAGKGVKVERFYRGSPASPGVPPFPAASGAPPAAPPSRPAGGSKR